MARKPRPKQEPIITVIRPELTPEEYERRHKRVEEAVVKLFIAHDRYLAEKAAKEREAAERTAAEAQLGSPPS